MSKKWKEKRRINDIIERESTRFPGVNPDHVRKIWLDGFAEGKQTKLFPVSIKVGDH